MQRSVHITVQAETPEQARAIAEMWIAIPEDENRDVVSVALPAIRNSMQERWRKTGTTELTHTITEGP
jgi:hypothetical protein